MKNGCGKFSGSHFFMRHCGRTPAVVASRREGYSFDGSVEEAESLVASEVGATGDEAVFEVVSISTSRGLLSGRL